MNKIVLLGSGNVATHLYKAISETRDFEVVQVYNHTQNGLDYFTEKTNTTTSLEQLAEASLYIIAVKDDAIAEIAAALRETQNLVVHTSGSVSINALSECSSGGIFYPLQTFSKEKELDYSNIPFCLEANSDENYKLLEQLALAISGKAYKVNSEQRKKLHLSAVFVCNFVNHLYVVGEEICQKGEIPFEILKPLINETANKIENASPASVQTGPAMRNDQSTITAHLDLLKDNPEQEKIYKLLTAAITNFHGKKL